MKFAKFTPVNAIKTLFLGAIPFASDAPTVEVRRPVHHFFIIDKSGSMWSTLPGLIEDLKKQVRNLKTGDSVTFGWFSSRGESGFPIKARTIVDENSFRELDRLFDEHKEAMNLTCFSDSLAEVGKIVEETKFLDARNCLTFFSDGWANDRSVSEEHKLTREIMRGLFGKFELVLTVAYSDYADRAFLAEMAQLAGGECISSAYLHQFTDAIGRFIKRAEVSAPRVKIDLTGVRPEFVFCADGNPETGGITIYQPDDQGQVFISPNRDAGLDHLYLLVRDGQSLKNLPGYQFGEFDLQRALIVENTPDDPFTNIFSDQNYCGLFSAAYAAAVVLSQNGRQDEALDVLGFIGDRRLVESLGSAFTPSERANAEDDIRTAFFYEERRHTGGAAYNCVPAADAFCLLDLLAALSKDDQALFYPRHPEFKYRKIGRGGKPREGYPVFTPNPGVASRFEDFVWNKQFLNLSVRAKITGVVDLPEVVVVDQNGKLCPDGTQALKRPDSLPETIETFQWRNYALVKDGFLNIRRLPVTCSPWAAVLFEKNGVWVWGEETTLDGKSFSVLQLDKIPVINKQIAENPPSAFELATLVYTEEVLKASMKVYKELRNELDPKKEIVQKTTWTVEEQRFLTALGFSLDGSFSPPVEQAEATDHYDAVCFKIEIKGFSSLPKVADVRDRLKSGKPLTPAMRPMAECLKAFASQTEHDSVTGKIRWLDDRLSELKSVQTEVRIRIQKPKFAMLLGHKSFTDLTLGDDETELPLKDDLVAKISITKKQVKI